MIAAIIISVLLFMIFCLVMALVSFGNMPPDDWTDEEIDAFPTKIDSKINEEMLRDIVKQQTRNENK